MKFIKLAGILVTLLPSVGLACSPQKECILEDGRHYKIALPDGQGEGAILFAHGFGGSATQTISNQSLRAMANDLNLALIAVKSAEKDWSIPNAPSALTNASTDEIAYIEDVMQDVQKRFSIAKADTVVSGFSAGAMLTWTLACEKGEDFLGFVPMSGVFWSPTPHSCPSEAASVIHIHGDNDTVVPLTGRPVQDTHQGDVLDVLDFYGRHGAFVETDETVAEGLRCQVSVNADGQRLEFCQFSGGHQFKVDFLRDAYLRLSMQSTG